MDGVDRNNDSYSNLNFNSNKGYYGDGSVATMIIKDTFQICENGGWWLEVAQEELIAC